MTTNCISFPRAAGLIVAIGLLLLLAACTVGPDYAPPETPLPAGWVSDNATPDADGVQREWWKNFHDPILDRLIDQAVASNPDVKIAEARINEARAARASARAALLPTGGATGQVTRLDAPKALAFPGLANPLTAYQAGFDASWELDLFGGHRRDIESANAQLEASEASRDDTLVSLMAEVARDYVDIRQYQAQLAVTNATIATDRASLAIARQQFNVGQAPGLDVTQAEAQLETAETQLPNFRNQLAQTAFSLDVLLGQPPGTAQKLIGGAGPIPVSDQTFVLAAPARTIANRPDIRVAERKLAAATAQQGVAVAQFFPDVSLQGFIGLINTDAGSLFNVARSGSNYGIAKVAWPILSYGSLQANLDQANAQQQEALLQYQKTILTALSDVERAVTAYTEQDKLRLALLRTVASDRQAAKVARERYREGMTSFLEVLDAERTLFSAQVRLTQAEAQASQDLVAVYKSLGGGWQAPK